MAEKTSRRKSREIALKIRYQADLSGDWNIDWIFEKVDETLIISKE